MSAWFFLNRCGRVRRRMELDSITPLPRDVAQGIERLHRRMEKQNDVRVTPR